MKNDVRSTYRSSLCPMVLRLFKSCDNYVTISVIRYLTYHFESVTIFNKFILSYEKNSLIIIVDKLNNIIANIDIIKQFKILILIQLYKQNTSN